MRISVGAGGDEVDIYFGFDFESGMYRRIKILISSVTDGYPPPTKMGRGRASELWMDTRIQRITPINNDQRRWQVWVTKRSFYGVLCMNNGK
jgi:hypothetical protein